MVVFLTDIYPKFKEESDWLKVPFWVKFPLKIAVDESLE